MSFREKSAWVSFGAILLVFGLYFGAVMLARAGDLDPVRLSGLFVLAVIALVVIEVVLHVAFAIAAPRDAQAPADERERLITLRAIRPGSYILAVGVFLGIFALHFGADGRQMAQALLFAFVVAELVRYGTEIVLH